MSAHERDDPNPGDSFHETGTPGFWDGLYAERRQPWDLGGPAPALVDFVTRTPPPRGRVAVPGCGRGHDVRFLARQGYDAVGFDFSPRAVRAARTLGRLEGVPAPIEERDVFTLAADHRAAFDGVWDYTSYCAIDPARRAAYVEVLATILRPGGWLLADLYPTSGPPGGPPFVVDLAEFRRLLRPAFTVEAEFAPPRAPEARSGREWVVHATRRHRR